MATSLGLPWMTAAPDTGGEMSDANANLPLCVAVSFVAV